MLINNWKDTEINALKNALNLMPTHPVSVTFAKNVISGRTSQSMVMAYRKHLVPSIIKGLKSAISEYGCPLPDSVISNLGIELGYSSIRMKKLADHYIKKGMFKSLIKKYTDKAVVKTQLQVESDKKVTQSTPVSSKPVKATITTTIGTDPVSFRVGDTLFTIKMTNDEVKVTVQ